MKRLSVRKKLTLWMTALMLALVIVVLGFLFAVSSRVAMQSAQEQLESFVRGNLTSITMENDTLQFGEGFQFTRSGMYLLVYNASGALLAGQTPLSYPTSVPFENGLTRLVSDDQADDVYLTLDFWLPFGWDDGVWVRGVMQEPEVSDAMHRLLDISLLLLPLIVLVGGVGVYRIVRRAFQPIDRIVAAASRISEGRDLSQRIGLPPGKDEISQLAAAFDQMFERLERAFEAESRFTSDASHELRTPTAVILAQCREAEQHAKTLSDYAEAVEVIHRQADRMSGLIGQLLQMTHLEQGTVPLCLDCWSKNAPPCWPSFLSACVNSAGGGRNQNGKNRSCNRRFPRHWARRGPGIGGGRVPCGRVLAYPAGRCAAGVPRNSRAGRHSGAV